MEHIFVRIIPTSRAAIVAARRSARRRHEREKASPLVKGAIIDVVLQAAAR
jgi:hypothetical protein